jgi:hypothetical protein
MAASVQGMLNNQLVSKAISFAFEQMDIWRQISQRLFVN